jgi:hypothetical protein
LILGFGNDLESDFLTVTGIPIEVLLEGAAMVLDADGLALDFAGAVAALVDQYPQDATAADSARSRTLLAGAACSGPGRRATAGIGSSSEQHSSSKTEERFIHSPERIRVDPMSFS